MNIITRRLFLACLGLPVILPAARKIQTLYHAHRKPTSWITLDLECSSPVYVVVEADDIKERRLVLPRPGRRNITVPFFVAAKNYRVSMTSDGSPFKNLRDEVLVMRLRNAKLVAVSADKFVWFQVDGVSLYCDGVVLYRATAKGRSKADANDCAYMIKCATGLWNKSLTEEIPAMDNPTLCGNFEFYYRRFTGPNGMTYINERYARMFDIDAVFCGDDPHKRVLVYEDHKLVGVVMPVKADIDQPPVPVPGFTSPELMPDDVVYHTCPEFPDD